MIIPVVASPWKPGAVCTIILLLLASISTLVALDRTLVPVAAYPNRPEMREKLGKRSITLLNDRKIINFLGDRLFDDAAWAQWKKKHGDGFAIIFVPRDQSVEARRILAKAIETEGLQVMLKNDDGTAVEPATILKPAAN